MKKSEIFTYVCPYTGGSMSLTEEVVQNDIVIEGFLVNACGEKFYIRDGIPDFTWPKELHHLDAETRQSYELLAADYHKYANIPFETYRVKEDVVRERMVEKLRLSSTSKVLEIGGGDGRGAEYIVKRLGKGGKLYFQELSPAFLQHAVKRLAGYDTIDIEYSIANGCYLSFPDNAFDAAHHFGGINTFSDVARCLSELARVVRPGGRVVVGDESLGPWLRDTEFGRIMSNCNPLLKYEIPFDAIPVEARDVVVEWIMLGAFFTLDFTVATGEPEADYHVNIPSNRGGTHWTRYHGTLEGVTDEAKSLAMKAREKSGKSMHEWLDAVVKEAAQKDLNR